MAFFMLCIQKYRVCVFVETPTQVQLTEAGQTSGLLLDSASTAPTKAGSRV